MAENIKYNLKIDSSYIGMESGRTYQSRSTGKLSFRVQMGSTDNQSQVSGGLNNSEDALAQEHALGGKIGTESKEEEVNQQKEEQNQELNEAQGKLNQNAGIRRIPHLNRVEEYNALEDIRQQCILYLWTIFFGKSRANEMADKMGVRSYNRQMTEARNANNSWM